MAQGEYLAFLDADDIWRPSKLRVQLGIMRTEHIKFSCTGYQIISQDGEHSGRFVVVKTLKNFTYTDLLAKKLTCGCSTVMIHSSLVRDCRMPLLRSIQDYAF